MARRFPLFTDENIDGPLIDALRRAGWDVVRAIDIFGEKTHDPSLFTYAAEEGRVFVSTDEDTLLIASRWVREWRPFPGLVWWRQSHRHRLTVGDFVRAFEDLAAEEEPFAYPIRYVTPQ